jgi:N-acetylmuramoyl-L-alanine amidase
MRLNPVPAVLAATLFLGAVTPALARPHHASASGALISRVAWERHHLVIAADRQLQVRLLKLSKPSRVAIDILDAELADPSLAESQSIDEGAFKQLRVAPHPDERFVRFVIDCDGGADFRLEPLEHGSAIAFVPDEPTKLASHERFGPPRPERYGPDPAEPYGPPSLPLVYGPPVPEGFVPSQPDVVEAPPEVTTALRWDGHPQTLAGLELVRKQGHITLKLVGDRPLSYELHQDWEPSRLVVRVPKGSYPHDLPSVVPGVTSLAAAHVGSDWVLTMALPQALYAVTARRRDHGRELAISLDHPVIRSDRPTIVVDAGHGGNDPGALGASGARESTFTLGLAEVVRSALVKSRRVNVVMTRSSDESVDLAARAHLLDMLKPALFVSLHGNSCPDPSIGGLETFYRNPGSAPFARFLQRRLVQGMHRPDRGIRQARLFVLRHPTVPSILIESAYLSNPSEERLMTSPTFQKEMGQAIAQGVLGYLDRTPVADAGLSREGGTE